MKRGIILAAAGLLALSLSTETQAGGNTYGLGIEGFRDTYKEPDLDVKDTTNYGSITGYYARQVSKRAFVAVDARGSHGTDDYTSPVPSGNLSGVPQWEFELRARYGQTYQVWDGDLSPYIGLGWRYFIDKGKGYVTDTGAQAYDRRISQFYIPIGATFAFTTNDGWSITPLAETDIMFYGNVDSRLTNINSPFVQFLDPANNTQHFGIGLRGELMFGKTLGSYTVQMGPFVRYWYVNQSNSTTYYDVNTGLPALDVYEPKNNRTQVGAALRVLW